MSVIFDGESNCDELVRGLSPVTPLTERERECLSWAAHGFTAQEIAKQIGLSPSGVNFHFAKATRKLGARNRTHAVAIMLCRTQIARRRRAILRGTASASILWSSPQPKPAIYCAQLGS